MTRRHAPTVRLGLGTAGGEEQGEAAAAYGGAGGGAGAATWGNVAAVHELGVREDSVRP